MITYSTIKKLCDITAVAGGEERLTSFIAGLMAPYADEIRRDALGNLICLRRGTAPDKKRILLAAHADEVGFIVTFIEQNGYLRCDLSGSPELYAAAYAPVRFESGVRGVIAPDDCVKSGDISARNIYIDIGARNRREAERRVAVGDCCALEPSLRRLSGTLVCGRPLDDRVGCAVLLDVAQRLTQKLPADDVYFVFTVQEEVGCRGSKAAAFAVSPDFALAIDLCAAGDVPGASGGCRPLTGRGAAIKLKDGMTVCDRGVCDTLMALAEDAGIPVQPEVGLSGGTDASSIQLTGSGSAVGGISIPCRRPHTQTETVDLEDAKRAAALAELFVLSRCGEADIQ